MCGQPRVDLFEVDPEVPTTIASGQGATVLLAGADRPGRSGRDGRNNVDALARRSPAALCASGRRRLCDIRGVGRQELKLTEAAREQNKAPETLDPYWRQSVKTAALSSRAGVRATTPDRLPLIGAVPDETRAREIGGCQTRKDRRGDAPIDGLLADTGRGALPAPGGRDPGGAAAGRTGAGEQAELEASPMRLILGP